MHIWRKSIEESNFILGVPMWIWHCNMYVRKAIFKSLFSISKIFVINKYWVIPATTSLILDSMHFYTSFVWLNKCCFINQLTFTSFSAFMNTGYLFIIEYLWQLWHFYQIMEFLLKMQTIYNLTYLNKKYWYYMISESFLNFNGELHCSSKHL